MLATRNPFDVSLARHVQMLDQMLGNRVEGWPTSQKPVIMMKI